MALLGLCPDARLFRIVDRNRKVLPAPRHGIVLSANLAETLDVSVGDWLTVEILEAKRPVVRLPIESLVSDFHGESAYADLSVVNRLMQEGNVVSGIFLRADARQINDLYRQLKETPRVASVTLKGAALTSIRATIAANILRMRAFNVGFACVIAFGVVYNSAHIALAERGRDLATLRVIGFRRGEVSGILLGELALLTLAAIPFGLFLGYVLADLVIRIAYDTELFRIPLVIDRWTYAFAATTTIVAAVCSGLIVARRIGQLDLIAVLKTRE
jgi:putative ABC transport system permease protein